MVMHACIHHSKGGRYKGLLGSLVSHPDLMTELQGNEMTYIKGAVQYLRA